MRQLASRSIPVLAMLAAVLAWPEPAAWAETTAEQQSRIERLRQESASLQRQGEPDQAIQRAAKAVELSNSVYGPSHPELAASLYGLAELHHMGGRYRDAEPLYRQALGIWERAEPPESGRLAGTMNALANLYYNQGRHAEAVPLFRRALGILERTYGPDHPRVAISLHGLAAVARAAGRQGEAERLYRRALDIRERKLGSDDQNVIATLNGLACVYQRKGRLDAA